MDESQASALRQLLLSGDIAALGTLHDGEPAVSMVPYAILPASGKIIIHVSRLASHTQDMEHHPVTSLMVVAPRAPDVPVQALARVSLGATATVCKGEAPDYAAARAAYLAKFPTSEPMFGFGDFSLYLLSPLSVRFIGGFGRAWSATAAQYQQAMAFPG